ncbi:hypothetical protein B0H15DRAFT_956310 [Mycena belliarum]|uniref:Uncharacterized protein n=1 Tax=Mycena belliarum TaxID=1033014 RepID=A0AAD6TUT9_9AGAR|nr:hypothetical protein B0H15DRAFT_956310 [Mycena belliae]
MSAQLEDLNAASSPGKIEDHLEGTSRPYSAPAPSSGRRPIRRRDFPRSTHCRSRSTAATAAPEPSPSRSRRVRRHLPHAVASTPSHFRRALRRPAVICEHERKRPAVICEHERKRLRSPLAMHDERDVRSSCYIALLRAEQERDMPATTAARRSFGGGADTHLENAASLVFAQTSRRVTALLHSIAASRQSGSFSSPMLSIRGYRAGDSAASRVPPASCQRSSGRTARTEHWTATRVVERNAPGAVRIERSGVGIERRGRLVAGFCPRPWRASDGRFRGNAEAFGATNDIPRQVPTQKRCYDCLVPTLDKVGVRESDATFGYQCHVLVMLVSSPSPTTSPPHSSAVPSRLFTSAVTLIPQRPRHARSAAPTLISCRLRRSTLLCRLRRVHAPLPRRLRPALLCPCCIACAALAAALFAPQPTLSGPAQGRPPPPPPCCLARVRVVLPPFHPCRLCPFRWPTSTDADASDHRRPRLAPRPCLAVPREHRPRPLPCRPVIHFEASSVRTAGAAPFK